MKTYTGTHQTITCSDDFAVPGIQLAQVTQVLNWLSNNDPSKQIGPPSIFRNQFEQAIYTVMDVKIADLVALIRSRKTGDAATDKQIELIAMKIEDATLFLRADVTDTMLALIGKTSADADALWILGGTM